MTHIPEGRRARRHPAHRRAVRPTLEPLEGRILLYSTTGGDFSQPRRITYSFVPDGTSIGGVSSNLFRALNARFGTDVWQLQFARAAAVWQKAANINLVQVPDGGRAIGVSGDQQGDSRFGDIRIGGFNQSSNQLAFAYLPPPINGGTLAGDLFFNTRQSWEVDGSTYDLMTVAIHEFGHALGLDHSSASISAAMWPSYTGRKQTLAADDVNGIRAIYSGRQIDAFDARGRNDSASLADDINPWVDSSGRLVLAGLDVTSPAAIGQGGDVDWYKITVPATTTGVMVVKMQASELSLLSPSLAIYDSAGSAVLAQASAPSYGDTASVTLTRVVPGQVFTIRCKGTSSGDMGYGNYGLQVNFTANTQPPVSPPNTTMAEQASRGGGSLTENPGLLGQLLLDLQRIVVGTLSGFGEVLTLDAAPHADHPPASSTSPRDPGQTPSVMGIVFPGIMQISTTLGEFGESNDSGASIDRPGRSREPRIRSVPLALDRLPG